MKRMAVLIILAVVLLSSCMPGGGRYSSQEPSGFLGGIWHGWIAPVSLIVSLFRSDIRVYETANKGWWYDFGFYVAIVGGFGGLSLSRRRRKMRRRDDGD